MEIAVENTPNSGQRIMGLAETPPLSDADLTAQDRKIHNALNTPNPLKRKIPGL